MEYLAAPIPIFFIVLSLIGIFDKDRAWKWQERSNKARGVKSERTKEWERSTTFGSIIALVINIFILIVLLKNSAII